MIFSEGDDKGQFPLFDRRRYQAQPTTMKPKRDLFEYMMKRGLLYRVCKDDRKRTIALYFTAEGMLLAHKIRAFTLSGYTPPKRFMKWPVGAVYDLLAKLPVPIDPTHNVMVLDICD